MYDLCIHFTTKEIQLRLLREDNERYFKERERKPNCKQREQDEFPLSLALRRIIEQLVVILLASSSLGKARDGYILQG